MPVACRLLLYPISEVVTVSMILDSISFLLSARMVEEVFDLLGTVLCRGNVVEDTDTRFEHTFFLGPHIRMWVRS